MYEDIVLYCNGFSHMKRDGPPWRGRACADRKHLFLSIKRSHADNAHTHANDTTTAQTVQYVLSRVDTVRITGPIPHPTHNYAVFFVSAPASSPPL